MVTASTPRASDAARRTAVYVANMRRAGHAAPRRRVPASHEPVGIERAYAAELVAVIAALRADFEREFADLAGLLGGRQRRTDAIERVRRVVGLEIAIEHPRGSVRRWSGGETVMRWDYGYIAGTEGADGDEVDVYVGPIADPLLVYAVAQRSKASRFSSFDEWKIMLGWDGADAARAAYVAQYDDPRFLGELHAFTVEDFKARLAAGYFRKPAPRRESASLMSARELRLDEGEERRVRDRLRRVRDRARRDSSREEASAGRAANGVSKFGREQIARQSRAGLGVDISPLIADPTWRTRLEGFIHENAALVTALEGKTVDDLEKVIMGSLVDGRRAEDITGLISERFAIAERHARLIARDQIGKLHGRLTQARHEELGIAQYRWLTMRDSRVRPRHKDREGKVYRYDAGELLPGQEILCRCQQAPLFDDIIAIIDEIEARPAAVGAAVPGATQARWPVAANATSRPLMAGSGSGGDRKPPVPPSPPTGGSGGGDDDGKPKKRRTAQQVAATKRASAASAMKRSERLREIHGAVRSTLPEHLKPAWDADGQEFIQVASGPKIPGVPHSGLLTGESDRINAAGKVHEAFEEQYGDGGLGQHAGDRSSRAAEAAAEFAEKHADELEAEYYRKLEKEMTDRHAPSENDDDDDVPF